MVYVGSLSGGRGHGDVGRDPAQLLLDLDTAGPADVATIKEAYFQLAWKYHPDQAARRLRHGMKAKGVGKGAEKKDSRQQQRSSDDLPFGQSTEEEVAAAYQVQAH